MTALNGYADQFLATLTRLWPRLVSLVVVLVFLRWGLRLIDAATHRILKRVDLAQEIEELIAQAVRVAIIAAGLIVILMVLGWGELALSFVAGLGITGLVVGFALQDITKNFAAGLLLLFLRPFRIGDRIGIGSEEGIVQELALRATTLRTDDGREVMIPNATIYTGTISNLTRYTLRRHTLPLKLKGDVPLATVLPRLRETIATVQGVQEQPAVSVLAINVTAEHVEIEARYWVPSRTGEAASINSQVVQRTRELLLEAGWLA